MNKELLYIKEHPIRAIGILFAVIVLVFSFLFQQVDWLSFIDNNAWHPYIHFISRKVFRVVINDFCLLAIIHLWFNDKDITRLSRNVFLIDSLILLPVYLLVKLTIEGDSEISSPLLSQLHRLIINPTLMILIIPGVYFQRLKSRREDV